jgi:formiminoglutamase
MTLAWLTVERRHAPLILSIPHAGVDLLHFTPRFQSAWLARRDADWHLPELYDFAAGLGATIVRTSLSRSIVDVNRDPSGASLYPGQATTELCPTTTFDGEPLYNGGEAPGVEEIAERRRAYFDPYHEALAAEIARLRATHGRIALYDAHSIRSRIPRLFDGELPLFNLGTNGGLACSAALRARLAALLAASGQSHVVDGRFKGGWITRAFGRPQAGVEAVQMELGCRAYMDEPEAIGPDNWPSPLDPTRAAVTRATLKAVLETLVAHVGETP